MTSLSETGHNDPESDKTVIFIKHFFVFVLGHCYIITEAAVCATDLWWTIPIATDLWWTIPIASDLWWTIPIASDLWWTIPMASDLWWTIPIASD